MRKKLIIWSILSLAGVFAVLAASSLYPRTTTVVQASIDNPAIPTPETFGDFTYELTPKEQAGQMLMFGIRGPGVTDATLEQMKQIQPAGFLLLGELSRTDILQMTTRLQQIQGKIPFFFASDQEGGVVKRFTEDTIADPASEAAHPDQICPVTKASSEWLKELGVNVNFGVIADIAWEPTAYIADRAYGNNPKTVSLVVQDKIECSNGIVNAVKHFPGHGRTQLNSHNSVPPIDISYEEWKKSDKLPFQTAIDHNVSMIMMGHLLYPQIATDPASISSVWIHELRSDGFKKVIITDDLGMLERSGYKTATLVEKGLKAGNDILLFSDTITSYSDIATMVFDDVENGVLNKEDLKKHAERVLELKKKVNDLNSE